MVPVLPLEIGIWCDKASINVSYLAKIENGYVNTTIRYLIKVARGLKVRVGELFEF